MTGLRRAVGRRTILSWKAAARVYDFPGELTEPRLRAALPERPRRGESRLGPAAAAGEHRHGDAKAERVAAKT